MGAPSLLPFKTGTNTVIGNAKPRTIIPWHGAELPGSLHPFLWAASPSQQGPALPPSTTPAFCSDTDCSVWGGQRCFCFTGNVADTSRRRGLPGYLLHLECTEFMCTSWAAIKGTYPFPRNQTGHLLHQKGLSGTNCRFLSLLQTNNSRLDEAFQTYRVIALSGNKLVLKLIVVRQYWLLERTMLSNKASEPQVLPPGPRTLRWASLVLLTAVSKS